MCVFLLGGCEQRQRGESMVINKEVPADFTMSAIAQKKSEQQAKTPMLPGKAQVIGAYFQDFPTQTGKATVLPSQVKVIEQPSLKN